MIASATLVSHRGLTKIKHWVLLHDAETCSVAKMVGTSLNITLSIVILIVYFYQFLNLVFNSEVYKTYLMLFPMSPVLSHSLCLANSYIVLCCFCRVLTNLRVVFLLYISMLFSSLVV